MNVKNRTIFSNDNLSVLRGIDTESVDLIYLDPPFNSNRNYAAPIGSDAAGAAFKDTWTLSDVDNAWHGEIADREPALYQAIHAAELTHGKGMKSYLIMMAVRLLEMKRVLKKTGSIYLHCDPTASHYLKTLMDSVFGKNHFKNEIVWNSATGVKNNVKTRFGRGHDIIFFYGMPKSKFNVQYEPLSEAYLKSHYTYTDEDGRRFRADNLNAPSTGGHRYEFLGVTRNWRMTEEQAHQWLAEGRIVHQTITPGSRVRIPSYKRYADESMGRPALDNWTDIGALNSQAKESTGYPTQKPVALLERIIKASSNKDEMVLDPFCGCATTCVAAERLQRHWIGIDVSPKAANLVRVRLEAEIGIFGDVIHRTDIPKRSEKLPNYRTHKHTLFGKQEGLCNGCRTQFPFRNMTVDHIVPQSQGGTDHEDNLQLLCGACNSTKGRGTQAELISRLKAQGVLR
ncbi:hypothetical protein F4054_14410 [Candidatus Poribacteria bacterium]|nr:hypothetical protein [Candidatus Poribacteria bacterium]MYK23440.1 hypothetical protein [Candidatus Poribacteria bacterium]